MKTEIQNKGGSRRPFDYAGYITDNSLAQIRSENNVDLILAIESGSRMWGFASPDSDFDVRFIYLNRDFRDNFSVSQAEDVIEYKDPNSLIDCTGWDIAKTISLMARGNGTVIDWLASPVVYAHMERPVALLKILQHYLLSFQPVRTRVMYHHRGLIGKAYKDGMKRCGGDTHVFPIKKYLYMLRSALLMEYMANTMHLKAASIPSPLIQDLILDKSENFRRQVQDLILIKSEYSERSGTVDIDKYSACSDYIDHWNKVIPPKSDDVNQPVDLVACNATLRAILSR